MSLWLVALARAAEPAPGPDPALDAYLRSVLYVVDAYVVKTVSFDLMGIAWTPDRHPPGTNREIRYCVHWARPPVGDDSTVVSEEWVVIDATGTPLGVERFAASTGLVPHRLRERGTLLGGVQLGFSRREVEAAVALREDPKVPSRTRHEVRTQVLARLEPPPCTEELPSPVDGS
jgi:hypothetical protein